MEKEDLFATKALCTERENRGLTQREMADVLSLKIGKNISYSLYQKWEQGRLSVNTAAAVVISRELEQSIKTLFSTEKQNA